MLNGATSVTVTVLTATPGTDSESGVVNSCAALHNGPIKDSGFRIQSGMAATAAVL